MFVKFLTILGAILVAGLILILVRFFLVALGIILPEIVYQLVGAIFLVGILVHALKLFGFDI